MPLSMRVTGTAVFFCLVLIACDDRDSPGGPVDPEPEVVWVLLPDPSMDLDIAVNPVCNTDASRSIEVSWRVDLSSPESITISTQLGSGQRGRVRGSGRSGRLEVKVMAEEGGILIVTAAADSNDILGNRAIILPPCVEPPPLPGAGERFASPPVDPPQPPVTDRDRPLIESEFVHLGGLPASPNEPLMVSAVGTGSVVKLSSWRLDPNTLAPVHLDDSNAMVGHHVRLHVLTPGTSPKLVPRPFITGVIRDGQLWLSTWQVAEDGGFLAVDSHGYGEDIEVRRFAIAHHSVQIGDGSFFLIVTPIITSEQKLRIITWLVNRTTGEISGLQDNGDSYANPAESGQLHIVRVPGEPAGGMRVDYVVTYENSSGDLAQQVWEVLDAGLALLRGAGASGLNLRGSANVKLPGGQHALLPLNGEGYVLAVLDGLSVGLSTWDFQRPYLDPLFVPHRVADNSLDMLGGPGVNIGQEPALTDGSSEKVKGGAVQKVRARLTDEYLERNYGVGEGALVDVMPLFEFTSVGIASVTKVMTLLLAVEAELGGEVDYADIVTVSANAADTGGSSMNLVAGEKQTLANLIYGMMMVSGNDASVAIAEHVAGSEEAFVQRMNQRAAQLGLADTSYNQPAGGGYSTPQDQITLFRFGSQYPDFLRYANEQFYVACGELPGGEEICRNIDKFNGSLYPGLMGWKNGNLGFHDPEKLEQGVPLCTSCLIAQVRRAGRTMLVGIQQSGNRWGDARRLFDYGFRLTWTPDLRGSLGLEASPAQRDIGIAGIDDGIAVTSALEGDNLLELCTFSLFTDLGQIDRLSCTVRSYPGLPGNQDVSVPLERVAGVRLSNAFSEGDYVTADLSDSRPRVLLWRLGPKSP